MIRYIVLFLLGSIQWNVSSGQATQENWVNTTYNNMSLDEKIGQLFMIRASSTMTGPDRQKILSHIDQYNIGGLCFFQGDPTQMVKLNNTYQAKSKIPLLVSIDGEWGLGMRYPKQSISFPRALTLGAIQDDNLIYEMGEHIAEHCKRLGIHINFAPVVDVNNNPNNPVINNRSFGEDKYNVAAKSYSYMKGMQDNGVMACAKHFPGHGDTDVDSHLDLPIIRHTRQRLDSIEMMPFRSLIKQGLSSVMVAHLNIPILDDRPNRPTTLSENTVTNILRNNMAFSGLIFTDAMEMKGVTKHFAPGDADKEAFLAGNDVILLPENLRDGFNAIKKGILDNTIPRERLENSVKRILRAKYIQGLTTWKKLDEKTVHEDINDNYSLALKERLLENALTVASDDDEIIPIRKLNNKKIATISIGAKGRTEFQRQLLYYVTTENYNLPRPSTSAQRVSVEKQIKDADYVIAGIHDMSKYASKDFGLFFEHIKWLKKISEGKKLIIVLFGSPYALKYFDDFSNVIVAYNDEELTQRITAQGLMGAFTLKGKLPVSASEKYKYNDGEYRESLGRLGFSIPERVGMSSEKLAVIDSIVNKMINGRAAPGCQIVAAKDGKVVFQSAYGNFTYEAPRQVDNNDIYDVASITKTCASTLSLMKLYDEKKFNLDATMDQYIPETDTCNKGDIVIRDALAHHARLAGWIPFYKNTMTKSNKPDPEFYTKTKRDQFTIPVTDDLFLRSDYKDSIWRRIYVSELRENAGYRYSDLSFYFMHKIIKNITTKPINEYTAETFYEPLGLRRTGYLPLERHPIEEIVPTEKDNYFRKELIRGHVHDMGSAMLGGVAGHAGLFSNASELAIIFQMLLNGGSYGGTQYFSPETIKEFTTRFPESTRRGIGFDMKELNSNKSQNMSELASDNTFGHLGFTGCAAFADPDENLIYIFLSNRTYPSMKSNKLGRENYRPKIHSQIYKALDKRTTDIVETN